VLSGFPAELGGIQWFPSISGGLYHAKFHALQWRGFIKEFSFPKIKNRLN
jgi:hypothetical protein